MKSDIVVLGGRDEIVGYRLAGVSRAYDVDAEDAASYVRGGGNVIFVTEYAHSRLGAAMAGIAQKNIVQLIPGKGGDYTRVGELIRSTLGFDLR